MGLILLVPIILPHSLMTTNHNSKGKGDSETS